jgi:hypothetical protein
MRSCGCVVCRFSIRRIRRSSSRREQQSITVARYKLVPVASGRYVMSPTYFTLGAEAVKSRLAHSRSQATS